MIKLLCLALFLIHSTSANAQGKHDYIWVSGYGTFATHFGGNKIDFSGGEPTITHFSLPLNFGLDVPCSISDEEGNLQFYANGCRIMGYDDALIENGDDLSPGSFQSIECDNYPYGYDGYQNMMILPRPGRTGEYVYFHHTIETDVVSGKILYSEVDMNANEGKGRVTRKNQLLRGPINPVEWVLTSVRHGNGRDWWVVIPQENVNVFNLYLLTPDTILGPYAQDKEDGIASLHEKIGWNTVFSPDGNMFIRVTLSEGFNRIFIYDFDRCTGTLSNSRVVKVSDPNVYASWAAISPNSKFLYFQIAQNKLFQFDLTAPDIESSGVLIGLHDGFTTPQGASTAFHAMALAPNNKIYMCCTSGTYYYHTIHAPDELGLACDFRQHDLQLPAVNNNLMPSYPNFRLYDVPDSPCDTLGINTPTSLPHTNSGMADDLTYSPNPANVTVNLEWPNPALDGYVRVYNLQGHLMYEARKLSEQNTTSFFVKSWPTGIYLIVVEQPNIRRKIGKLVVAQ